MPIFERFIRYEWAEYALGLAVQKKTPQTLHTWLEMQGLRGDSPRRTANILTHMWFPREQNTRALCEEAIALYPTLSLSNHIALHWGMALANFPSFRQTAQIVGRLLSLHGYFYKTEIVSRVLEQYSNQSTVKRAVERTIQSMQDWNILKSCDSRYESLLACAISHPSLTSWLYRALLTTDLEYHWRVSDLILSNELFPFEIDQSLLVLHQDPAFTFHRDAEGDETVGLRN